jgi:hypothetical protein
VPHLPTSGYLGVNSPSICRGFNFTCLIFSTLFTLFTFRYPVMVRRLVLSSRFLLIAAKRSDNKPRRPGRQLIGGPSMLLAGLLFLFHFYYPLFIHASPCSFSSVMGDVVGVNGGTFTPLRSVLLCLSSAFALLRYPVVEIPAGRGWFEGHLASGKRQTKKTIRAG